MPASLLRLATPDRCRRMMRGRRCFELLEAGLASGLVLRAGWDLTRRIFSAPREALALLGFASLGLSPSVLWLPGRVLSRRLRRGHA